MVGVMISSTYMKLYAYFKPYLKDNDDSLAEVRFFTLKCIMSTYIHICTFKFFPAFTHDTAFIFTDCIRWGST